MGGSVPRPEFTGDDVRDLIYYIRRSTLGGSYPTPVQPGADAPFVGFPNIFNVTATRLSGPNNRIHFTWDTDQSTIGFVALGSPNQAGFTTGFGACPYCVFSPIESGFSTTGHSIMADHLPLTTPTHFSIVVRNNKGTCSHTTDQTVL